MLVRIALAALILASPSTRVGGSATSPDRSGTGAAGPRQYALRDVGLHGVGAPLGGLGLSDAGFLVASEGARGAHTAPRGFRRTLVAAGGDDDVLVPECPTWVGCSAVDVNASGTFVGSFSEEVGAPFLTRGYRWKDGVIDELFTPLGQRAFPGALNDGGWIVGQAGIQPEGSPGAVLWDPGLGATFVADLTHAVDVNERVQVVGYRNDSSGTARGFLWDAGELVPLGSLDPRGLGAVFPRAIDEHGRVVGVSLVRGREHAFLWTRETGMRELRGPSWGQPLGGVGALDVNTDGWVIGFAATTDGMAAVRWSPEGEVVELAALVPRLRAPGAGSFRALRIDASGRIAGTLTNETGTRTVLLTPRAASAAPVAGAMGLIRR